MRHLKVRTLHSVILRELLARINFRNLLALAERICKFSAQKLKKQQQKQVPSRLSLAPPSQSQARA